MTEAAAALLWKSGAFMICQRPTHKARGLLWEFAGGKVEPGKTKEQVLIRECREELDVQVAVDEEFTQVTHVSPDLTVHLTVFHARITGGTVEKLEHHDIRYIDPGRNFQLRFLSGGSGHFTKADTGGDTQWITGTSPLMWKPPTMPMTV